MHRHRHLSRSACALARAEATASVCEARLGRSRTRTKVGATCETGNGHYCSNSESNRFHYRSPPNRFLLLLASKQSRIHWVRDSLATEKCMVVHFFGNLFPVAQILLFFEGCVTRVAHFYGLCVGCRWARRHYVAGCGWCAGAGAGAVAAGGKGCECECGESDMR